MSSVFAKDIIAEANDVGQLEGDVRLVGDS